MRSFSHFVSAFSTCGFFTFSLLFHFLYPIIFPLVGSFVVFLGVEKSRRLTRKDEALIHNTSEYVERRGGEGRWVGGLGWGGIAGHDLNRERALAFQTKGKRREG